MDNQTITLLDYFRLFYRQKWLIIVTVTIGTVAAIIYSQFIPPVYKSTAVIMMTSSSSGGGLSIGGLASLALGGVGGLGSTDENIKKTKALLQSYVLAENALKNNPELVTRINELSAVKGQPAITDPQAALHSAASSLKGWITSSYDQELGVTQIFVSSPEAKLSKDLVIVVLQELNQLMTDLSNSSSKRTREFVGHQLTAYRREFLEAGKLLSIYYQKNNITSDNTSLTVNVSPEFHLYDLAPNVSDIKKSTNVFEAYSHMLNHEDIESKSSDDLVKNIPHNVFFEYLLMHREMLRLINGTLTQQYESSKMDEVKQSESFQLLDLPEVPRSFSKSKRRIVVLVGFVLSSIVAIFASLLRELWFLRPREA